MSRGSFSGPESEPSPALLRAIDTVVLDHMRRPFIDRNKLVSDIAESVLEVTQPLPPLGLTREVNDA